MNNFLEQIQIRNNNTTKKQQFRVSDLFRNINRLFVLSFRNGDNDPTRYPVEKYYMSLVEIKDFNELIDNKPFFD